MFLIVYSYECFCVSFKSTNVCVSPRLGGVLRFCSFIDVKHRLWWGKNAKQPKAGPNKTAFSRFFCSVTRWAREQSVLGLTCEFALRILMMKAADYPRLCFVFWASMVARTCLERGFLPGQHRTVFSHRSACFSLLRLPHWPGVLATNQGRTFFVTKKVSRCSRWLLFG